MAGDGITGAGPGRRTGFVLVGATVALATVVATLAWGGRSPASIAVDTPSSSAEDALAAYEAAVAAGQPVYVLVHSST